MYFYTISSVIPVNNEATIISGHHPLKIFTTPDNKNVDRYPEPDVQQPWLITIEMGKTPANGEIARRSPASVNKTI